MVGIMDPKNISHRRIEVEHPDSRQARPQRASDQIPVSERLFDIGYIIELCLKFSNPCLKKVRAALSQQQNRVCSWLSSNSKEMTTIPRPKVIHECGWGPTGI